MPRQVDATQLALPQHLYEHRRPCIVKSRAPQREVSELCPGEQPEEGAEALVGDPRVIIQPSAGGPPRIAPSDAAR